jgi:hypothetical protein
MATVRENEKFPREDTDVLAEPTFPKDDIAVVEATALNEEDRKLAELGYSQVCT